MKAKFLAISFGILALTSACNNNSESTAKENDTTIAEAKDTAVAVAPAPRLNPSGYRQRGCYPGIFGGTAKIKKDSPRQTKKTGQERSGCLQ